MLRCTMDMARTSALASNEAGGRQALPMRDIFNEIFAGERLDPKEAARRGMRPQLRQRFYQQAQVMEAPAAPGAARTAAGFAIGLDRKVVHTPARRVLAAPTHALAQAIAAEWDAQQEVIDPLRMPLTRLANSIIDGVADAPGAVAAEIGKYVASDLLFYRAAGPRGLVTRQAQHWDPVLAWARDRLGARFILGEGVVFVAQPEAAVAAAQAALPADPWLLGALSAITTLTGSALLALALWHGVVSVEAVWTAALVDEDWNMDQWGRDALALERRAARFAELEAAAKVLALIGPSTQT